MIKEIPGFPGYYADKQGSIWSRRPLKNSKIIPDTLKRLKTGKYKLGGYLYVIFSYGKKKRYTKKVHKLILETFVGPCPLGVQACHNDGNPENNRKSNLRWDTPSNNNLDKKKHGTFQNQKGEKGPNSKLTRIETIRIKELLEERQLTQAQIGEIFGVGQPTISEINTGKAWKEEPWPSKAL